MIFKAKAFAVATGVLAQGRGNIEPRLLLTQPSCDVFIQKMCQPRHLFHLFLSFLTHITNFTTNRYVKNVHPVYVARNQTHDLWNMSLLP